MIASFFARFGITRDSVLFLWGKILSALTLIVTGVLQIQSVADFVGIHLTEVDAHRIWAVAVVVLYLSGQYSTSSLKGASTGDTVSGNTLDKIAKSVPVVLLALLIGASVSGCAGNKPPNLSPQASIAWDNARIQGALDQIRDIAHVANAQHPPLISTADTRTITTWHRAAIVTLHERGNGWQATLRVGLDEVLRTLPPDTRAVLDPYVALFKTLLAEVS